MEITYIIVPMRPCAYQQQRCSRTHVLQKWCFVLHEIKNICWIEVGDGDGSQIENKFDDLIIQFE